MRARACEIARSPRTAPDGSDLESGHKGALTIPRTYGRLVRNIRICYALKPAASLFRTLFEIDFCYRAPATRKSLAKLGSEEDILGRWYYYLSRYVVQNRAIEPDLEFEEFTKQNSSHQMRYRSD